MMMIAKKPQWLTMKALVLSFSIIFCFPCLAVSEQINIKGIYIGMTEKEISDKWGPTLHLEGLTVGGVRSKYLGSGNADLDFDNGRLSSFYFFFDSKNFEDVFAAVKSKYPTIKCEHSTVSNAMGAKFDQVECMIQDNISILRMSRFVSDISTSSLSMMSHKKMMELVGKDETKKSDI